MEDGVSVDLQEADQAAVVEITHLVAPLRIMAPAAEARTNSKYLDNHNQGSVDLLLSRIPMALALAVDMETTTQQRRDHGITEETTTSFKLIPHVKKAGSDLPFFSRQRQHKIVYPFPLLFSNSSRFTKDQRSIQLIYY